MRIEPVVIVIALNRSQDVVEVTLLCEAVADEVVRPIACAINDGWIAGDGFLSESVLIIKCVAHGASCVFDHATAVTGGLQLITEGIQNDE